MAAAFDIRTSMGPVRQNPKPVPQALGALLTRERSHGSGGDAGEDGEEAAGPLGRLHCHVTEALLVRAEQD
jgi:hypothetical protein